MKIALGHVLAAMVIVLAGARPALAADAADAPVIEALLRFLDALESGDARVLEQSIAAETSFQERSRKNFADLAAAQKALEKSALKQFGDEGKIFRCGFELIVSGADRRTIANAKVYYDDLIRSARIEKPGELAQMSLRRNQDTNQWQVVLEHIEWGDDDPANYYIPPGWPMPGMARQAALAAIKATRNTSTIEAFTQTRARIDSGDLSSASAAQTELLNKLAAARAEEAKAKAAIPSGRLKERP
jgi:hypothetical protein